MDLYLWWCKVTKKKWCKHNGYSCKDKDCKYEHLDEPIPWPTTIPEGTKCVYCGKNPATEIIDNPNWDIDERAWFVCKTCKEVIKWQHQSSMGIIMADRLKDSPQALASTEKLVNEANTNLERIAKETGQPILNAGLYKQPDGHYETVSIEYTGEKDDKS